MKAFGRIWSVRPQINPNDPKKPEPKWCSTNRLIKQHTLIQILASILFTPSMICDSFAIQRSGVPCTVYLVDTISTRYLAHFQHEVYFGKSNKTFPFFLYIHYYLNCLLTLIILNVEIPNSEIANGIRDQFYVADIVYCSSQTSMSLFYC